MSWLYTFTIRGPQQAGKTPQELNFCLRQQWARVRADLRRRAVKLRGLRCVSPLPCATPVWEVVLCFDGKDDAQLAILAIDAKLSAGYEYSIAFVPAGQMRLYAARYLAKADCLRVEAWASTWGIRRHVRIGAGLPELVGGGA